MKRVISNRDNKEYFLCKASEASDYVSFEANGARMTLYGKGNYQVRKATKEDNLPEGYVVFNGSVWNESQSFSSLLGNKQLNGYSGTYMFGVGIPSSVAKEIFTYII